MPLPITQLHADLCHSQEADALDLQMSSERPDYSASTSGLLPNQPPNTSQYAPDSIARVCKASMLQRARSVKCRSPSHDVSSAHVRNGSHVSFQPQGLGSEASDGDASSVDSLLEGAGLHDGQGLAAGNLNGWQPTVPDSDESQSGKVTNPIHDAMDMLRGQGCVTGYERGLPATSTSSQGLPDSTHSLNQNRTGRKGRVGFADMEEAAHSGDTPGHAQASHLHEGNATNGVSLDGQDLESVAVALRDSGQANHFDWQQTGNLHVADQASLHDTAGADESDCSDHDSDADVPSSLWLPEFESPRHRPFAPAAGNGHKRSVL
eukprot:jgi/Chrzof1/1128/Cz01g41080.t1